jgi:hypothetical protein
LASLGAAVKELMELNRADAIADDASAEITELVVP